MHFFVVLLACKSVNRSAFCMKRALLPVVCKRVHVLFTLFVFVCVEWCPPHIVLYVCFSFFILCTLCCQFFWIVNFWLPLRCSLMLILYITLVYSLLKILRRYIMRFPIYPLTMSVPDDGYYRNKSQISTL